MGDSTSAARISGDDKGLVKYVHIETGLLSENTPAGTFSVGNRIEDASWSGDVLVLKFLNAGDNSVLAIPDRADIDYVFRVGELTAGVELEELIDRQVFAYMGKKDLYGFSFEEMGDKEVREHGVVL
ncbi:hypothetical protein HN935_01175 [archaeon]|jgi:hypothetical protein|nr:hypothetical protein [archaeon]